MQGFSISEFPNLLQNDKLLVKMPRLAVIKTELQFALKHLTEHSLTNCAKWYSPHDAGLANCFLG